MSGQETCPVQGCPGGVYLVLAYSVPLYIDEPASSTPPVTTDHATTNSWEVVCSEGHTTWTHVDQARIDGTDMAGDYATPFNPLTFKECCK